MELFEPTIINGMPLSNRFVRSATWEGLATPEGYATEPLTRLLVDLAIGKVGLIITSHAYVRREGIAAPGQLGIYSDDHVAPLKRMVDHVHAAGGRVALQVSHGGRYALKLHDTVRIAPSSIESKGEAQCREMTREEIEVMIESFALAARRAKAAGCDAVQVHAAHGYLVSEFLSPYFNKRTDEYGGPVNNRARFLLEIIAAMRHDVGDSFPLMVKLNAQEFLEGGYTVEDMLTVASLLENAGIDAIEMSGGHHVEGIFGAYFPARPTKASVDERPYYLDEVRRYKQHIRVPLMLVGGIRSWEWANRILSEGYADYISMSRPLIREPGLIARWQSGDTARATCISDNGCFKPGLEGKGIYCTVEAKQREQR